MGLRTLEVAVVRARTAVIAAEEAAGQVEAARRLAGLLGEANHYVGRRGATGQIQAALERATTGGEALDLLQLAGRMLPSTAVSGAYEAVVEGGAGARARKQTFGRGGVVASRATGAFGTVPLSHGERFILAVLRDSCRILTNDRDAVMTRVHTLAGLIGTVQDVAPKAHKEGHRRLRLARDRLESALGDSRSGRANQAAGDVYQAQAEFRSALLGFLGITPDQIRFGPDPQGALATTSTMAGTVMRHFLRLFDPQVEGHGVLLAAIDRFLSRNRYHPEVFVYPYRPPYRREDEILVVNTMEELLELMATYGAEVTVTVPDPSQIDLREFLLLALDIPDPDAVVPRYFPIRQRTRNFSVVGPNQEILLRINAEGVLDVAPSLLPPLWVAVPGRGGRMVHRPVYDTLMVATPTSLRAAVWTAFELARQGRVFNVAVLTSGPRTPLDAELSRLAAFLHLNIIAHETAKLWHGRISADMGGGMNASLPFVRTSSGDHFVGRHLLLPTDRGGAEWARDVAFDLASQKRNSR